MAEGKLRVQGAVSGNLLECTSNFVQVNKPIVINQPGYSTVAGVINDGSSGGVVLVRRAESSDSFRLRLGQESPLMFATFNTTQLNSSIWKETLTSGTVNVTINGYASILNTVTNAQGALLSTYRAFPIYQDLQTRLDFSFQLPQLPQFGTIINMGWGLPTTAIVNPSDGCFIRINQFGEAFAVVSNNTNEQVAPLPSLSIGAVQINTRYDVTIFTDVNLTYFFINNILQAVISTSAVVPPVTVASTNAANEQFIFFQVYNVATSPAVTTLKISSVAASLTDVAGNRAYRDALCGLGNNAIQVPDGYANPNQTGNNGTANYINSTGPTSAVLGNAAAAYTQLGGQWQFAAVASSEQDNDFFGFSVQTNTVAHPGKSFYITNIRIDAVNTGAASATTATVIQWSIAVGSTGVSLATADAAGTKSPRRLAIGIQTLPITGAIGQQFNNSPLEQALDSPLVVAPGEWFHVIMKQWLGSATASQIYRGTVTINGYWE
jgi:hypothetical protein